MPGAIIVTLSLLRTLFEEMVKISSTFSFLGGLGRPSNMLTIHLEQRHSTNCCQSPSQ
jgi:hypothetical protein